MRRRRWPAAAMVTAAASHLQLSRGILICFVHPVTHPTTTRKCSPPRPNPLASKPVATHTNGSPFENPAQNPHLTPPH